MRLLPLLLFVALPALAGEPAFRAISYHDVQDIVAGDYDPDQFAVSTGNLIDQFTWLRDQGFNPISIDQLVAAQEGRAQLPDKAVLLTFDDGLVSVYTRVFPLLKLFDYPAVVSIVTNWIEMEGSVDYAGRQRGADEFLNWDQIRELQASGLVEIASHTHDLHKGVRGNPQRNLQPAAVTRIYADSGYETESDYLSRIEADLAQSAAIIAEETGKPPRVITWPYGKYNEVVASLAARQGMNIDLTLTPDERSTSLAGVRLVGRHLISANPKLEDFSADLVLGPRPPIVRVAQVDLDYLFDPDPVAQKANLDSLLDRIKALQISHVFLQAFSDDDADGRASAVYFPNRHLSVRADLFNRVAWQLKTRAEVQVFAWLPMLGFTGSAFDPEWRVLEYRDGTTAADPDSEPRLSPSSAAAQSRILELYEDLATYAHFDGLLFHDDGRLNGFEEYSPAAMHHYRVEFGTDVSPQILAVDPELRRRWIDLKARTLVDLSSKLLERVRKYRPGIKSARNIFASALLDDSGTEYLGQDFDAYLRVYDYVALMAMPAHEGDDDPERFYKQLVDQVRRREGGLERTIFELQTIDWSRSRPIPASELRGTMRWLQSLGVRHLGYYPDDFITGHPDVEQLRLGISLAEDLMGAVGP